MTSTHHITSQHSWSYRSFNLLLCTAGIIICYGAFSYFQEKITKRDYGEGEKKERFVYMQALVFMQCAINALVSFLPSRKSKSDNVPLRLYSICSTSYFLAMLSSNFALKWVNYPTQVLAKSCKPIPIMISGVLFAHKRYPLRKYLYVLIIVLGMMVFLYNPQKSQGKTKFEFGSGELLLLLSLAMDGTTGAVQDRIRHSYRTDKWSMMFSMNAISSAFLAITLTLSGELFKFVAFVNSYPFVLYHMMLFSISGAAGQYFIFKTVTDFGPLTCSIVTTLRKLFSLVLSIILFSHPYNNQHIIGTVLVFVALMLDALDSRKAAASEANNKKTNGNVYSSLPSENNGIPKIQ